MGWGSSFVNAVSKATDAAKSAARAAASTAKSAYDYAAGKAVQGYRAAKDAAVATATAAKDVAVAGAKAVKDGVVAGAGVAGHAVGRGLIEARYAQAAGPKKTAERAYRKAREALRMGKAGSPVQHCPAQVKKCAQLREAINKAEIAKDAYEPLDGRNRTIGGYKRLDPEVDAEEFEKLGLSAEQLNPTDSDFRAQIYKGVNSAGQTEYVIGFRGTAPRGGDTTLEKIKNNFKPGANVLEDVTQALGMNGPDDNSAYDRAMKMARTVKMNAAKDGATVSFSGHSLGGGLASAAAVVTGNPAHSYNAAGLHPNTVGGTIRKGAGKVEAIFSPSDPLSAIQDNSDLPKAYGNRHVVPFPDDRKIDLSRDTGGHGMDLVIEGLKQEQTDSGCKP